MPTLQKASRINLDPTMEPIPTDLEKVVGRPRLYATQVKVRMASFFDSLFLRSRNEVEDHDRLKKAQLVLYRKVKQVSFYKQAFRDLTGHEVSTKMDVNRINQLPNDKMVFELFRTAQKGKNAQRKIESLLAQIAKNNNKNYPAVLVAFISFAKTQKFSKEFVTSLEARLTQLELSKVDINNLRYIPQSPQMEASNKWQRVAVSSVALAMIALAGYGIFLSSRKGAASVQSPPPENHPQNNDAVPTEDTLIPTKPTAVAIIPGKPAPEQISPGLLARFRAEIYGNNNKQPSQSLTSSASTALVKVHPTLSVHSYEQDTSDRPFNRSEDNLQCEAFDSASTLTPPSLTQDTPVTLPAVNNSAQCPASRSSAKSTGQLWRNKFSQFLTLSNRSEDNLQCEAFGSAPTLIPPSLTQDTPVTLPAVNNSAQCPAETSSSALRFNREELDSSERQEGFETLLKWGQRLGTRLGSLVGQSFWTNAKPNSEHANDFPLIPSATITSTTHHYEPCETFQNGSRITLPPRVGSEAPVITSTVNNITEWTARFFPQSEPAPVCLFTPSTVVAEASSQGVVTHNVSTTPPQRSPILATCSNLFQRQVNATNKSLVHARKVDGQAARATNNFWGSVMRLGKKYWARLDVILQNSLDTSAEIKHLARKTFG